VQAGRLYFARRALTRADRILAVSHSSKRDLSREFGVPEEKIEVVYKRARRTVPARADAHRCRPRSGTPRGNDPFVLYAEISSRRKNLPRLIEAFAVAKADLRITHCTRD